MNSIYKDKRFWKIFFTNKLDELKTLGKILLWTVGILILLLLPYFWIKSSESKSFYSISISDISEFYGLECHPDCHYHQGQEFSIVTNVETNYTEPTEEQYKSFLDYRNEIHETYRLDKSFSDIKGLSKKNITILDNWYDNGFGNYGWHTSGEEPIDADIVKEILIFNNVLKKTITTNVVTNEFIPASPHHKECKYVRTIEVSEYGFAYLKYLGFWVILLLLRVWIGVNLRKAKIEYQRRIR